MIHEKRAHNHRISDEAKRMYRAKSVIRPFVVHVFDCIIISMGVKLTRKIDLERRQFSIQRGACWGPKNLIFNFFCYL